MKLLLDCSNGSDMIVAKPIYTYAKVPGLIYDVLMVNPTSLSAHKTEWKKVVGVWGKVIKCIINPKTQSGEIKIMSVCVALTPKIYLQLLKNLKLITLAESKAAFTKVESFKSLSRSSKIVDDFNVKYAVYKTSQDLTRMIDRRFLQFGN